VLTVRVLTVRALTVRVLTVRALTIRMLTVRMRTVRVLTEGAYVHKAVTSGTGGGEGAIHISSGYPREPNI
jgi:hypothetical protein